MTLKIYKKKLDYTYAFGIFPTIELLEKAPDKVSTVLLAEGTENSQGVKRIKELCNKHSINFDYSPKAISKIAKKENTHAVGVLRKFKTKLSDQDSHVLLVNPSDMGNVGTIIRSMSGFNVLNLAIMRPAVDIFDPRVVRSSMGSLFDINFEYFDSYLQYEERFPNHIKYPFVLDGKHTLGRFNFKQPSTLVFGNEGSGLQKLFSDMENTIKIDHSSKVDSLNLSIAVSLALYEHSKE